MDLRQYARARKQEPVNQFSMVERSRYRPYAWGLVYLAYFGFSICMGIAFNDNARSDDVRSGNVRSGDARSFTSVFYTHLHAHGEDEIGSESQTTLAHHHQYTSPKHGTIPTATSSPTATPVPPPTPIPSPVEGIDLVAHKLEVTQGVQDLRNSVRLVAGKRTFVRFHAYSNSDDPNTNAPDGDRRNGFYRTDARLRVIYDNVHGQRRETILVPINKGAKIAVRNQPNRDTLDHAFLFELPSAQTTGEVTLIAELNPAQSPREVNLGNNSAEVSVSFEPVPPLTLVLVGIGYGDNIYPNQFDRNQLIDWLHMVYPIGTIKVIHRDYYWGKGMPTCKQINQALTVKRFWDLQNELISVDARYYGLVDDRGGRMQGCVNGIYTSVGSGPTGTKYWSWDEPDGSYGDWYGGHELGHMYGLRHAERCGADTNLAHYPHPNGHISTARVGDEAVYGFNLNTQEIYGATWYDIMTYCPHMWISDYSYHKLLDNFHDVVETMPNYPYETHPQFIQLNRWLMTGRDEPSTETASTDRTLPTVTVLYPNGDEVFGNETIPVRWAAGDGDEDGNSDSLMYNVAYSSNNGVHWEMVAQFVTTTSIEIPAINIIPGQQSLIRVYASDGISTSVDQSDAPFVVQPPPPVIQIAPIPSQPTIQNQTVSLQGAMANVARGGTDPDSLQWFSDLDGFLGTGVQLSTAELQIGTHTITLVTLDTENNVVSDLTQLVVVADESQLVVADDLAIAPKLVVLDPHSSVGSQRITVDNANASTPIRWEVAVEHPWVEVDKVSGTTPDAFTLSYGDISQLKGGANRTSVTISSPDLLGESVELQVSMWIDMDDTHQPMTGDMLVLNQPNIVLDFSKPMNHAVMYQNLPTILTMIDETEVVGLDKATVDHMVQTVVAVENQNITESITWTATTETPWIQLNKPQGRTPDDFLIFTTDISGLSPGPQSGIIQLSTSAAPQDIVEFRVVVIVPSPTFLYLPIIE